MKTRALLAGLCLLAMGSVQVVSAAAPAKAPAKAKTEETEGKIDGLTIPRAQGFLGLKLVDSHFVLSFYDAKKKPVTPDAARATLRWPVRYQPADERTVLNPSGDGLTFTSVKFVKPPHRFKLFMSLYAENGDQPLESFVIDFAE